MISESTQTEHAAGMRPSRCITDYAFHAQIITNRDYRRRQFTGRRLKLGTRRDELILYAGLVPEPDLTPLRCINYLMESLHAQPVTVAEARAAVAKVTDYYTSLSQTASSPSPPRRSRRSAAGESEGGGTKPDSQEPRSLLATLNASQVNLTQQSANTQITDIQDALLLEVLRELCESRPLRLSRVSYRDQRRMREPVSLVDVPPGKRAVVIVDRRDPSFSIIVGVPAPPSRQSQDGLRDASNEAEALQFVTVAHRPIPWRRIVHRAVPKFSYRDCAMAYVEVMESDEDEDEDAATPGQDRRNRSEARRRRRSTEDLIGDESDNVTPSSRGSSDAPSEKARAQSPLATAGSKRSRGASSAGALSTALSSDDDLEPTLLSPGKERMLASHQKLFYSSEPFFTAEDSPTLPDEDPLLAIPLVGVGGGNRSTHRRGWMEKMLPLESSKKREYTVSKLHRHQNVDL